MKPRTLRIDNDMNNKHINSLMTRRVMSSLAHSKSMTDLRHDTTNTMTNQYSRSCVDLASIDSMRRSKSWSRITDQTSSWDKVGSISTIMIIIT